MENYQKPREIPIARSFRTANQNLPPLACKLLKNLKAQNEE